MLSCHLDKNIASQRLQLNLNDIDMWLRKWRIKPNVLKSVEISFTLKKDLCSQVLLDNAYLPKVTVVKYSGLHQSSYLESTYPNEGNEDEDEISFQIGFVTLCG